MDKKEAGMRVRSRCRQSSCLGMVSSMLLLVWNQWTQCACGQIHLDWVCVQHHVRALIAKWRSTALDLTRKRYPPRFESMAKVNQVSGWFKQQSTALTFPTWLYLCLLGHTMVYHTIIYHGWVTQWYRIRLGEGGTYLILCLPFFVCFKTAISVRSVLPILYFTDQVWGEATLGRFVRALGSVQGTCFLQEPWGLMKVVAR